ncbi:hypothetical protein [Limosilactobacillus reuteri]|uniref:hypothetical protein n=1 Tax=Limosilactobacillus reuteri TaxID=1598 RepID=UPI001C0FF4C2|nr:hypothetical protein [Limosilactobacillus reuteri]MBU5283059.1 hypothetical protein [Limosilactobacillus reuteri]
MSLVEKFTTLADGFRSLYGTTDKYSLDDMKTALSGLQIQRGRVNSVLFLLLIPSLEAIA